MTLKTLPNLELDRDSLHAPVSNYNNLWRDIGNWGTNKFISIPLRTERIGLRMKEEMEMFPRLCYYGFYMFSIYL